MEKVIIIGVYPDVRYNDAITVKEIACITDKDVVQYLTSGYKRDTFELSRHDIKEMIFNHIENDCKYGEDFLAIMGQCLVMEANGKVIVTKVIKGD